MEPSNNVRAASSPYSYLLPPGEARELACAPRVGCWARAPPLSPSLDRADGIYVKAGLEKEKAALLVDLAGVRDGRKVVLVVESGDRESAEAWGACVRSFVPASARNSRRRWRRWSGTGSA